jgi:hypothetical protein
LPTVAVVKEEANFYYENNDDDDARSSIEKYIKTQQFLTFTYLSCNFYIEKKSIKQKKNQIIFW